MEKKYSENDLWLSIKTFLKTNCSAIFLDYRNFEMRGVGHAHSNTIHFFFMINEDKINTNIFLWQWW